MPKRKPVPGVSLHEWEPEPGMTCQYDLQQKIGGRWTHEACGNSAVVIIRIGTGPEKEYQLVLCRECLARVTRQFVTFLE